MQVLHSLEALTNEVALAGITLLGPCSSSVQSVECSITADATITIVSRAGPTSAAVMPHLGASLARTAGSAAAPSRCAQQQAQNRHSLIACEAACMPCNPAAAETVENSAAVMASMASALLMGQGEPQIYCVPIACSLLPVWHACRVD